MHRDENQLQRFDPRYDTLDHWRGVAAIAVMLFHGFGTTRGAGPDPHVSVAWLKWLSSFGWFGVHLFFVISGYCIAANVYRLALNGNGPWHFLKDRFLRIFPPYWCACVLSVMVGLASLPFNRGSLGEIFPRSYDDLVANIFLVEPYVHATPFLLVSWSLVLELGFYLVVAFGFFLRQLGVNTWFLCGLAFLLGILGLEKLHSGSLYVLNCWAEFLCGASVFVSLWMRSKSVFWIIFAGAPAVFIGFAFIVMGDNPRSWQMAGAGLFAYVILLLHPFDRRINQSATLKWLASVGFVSYSLYLVHVFSGGRAVNLLSRYIEAGSSLYLVVQVAGWGVSLLTAVLFYRLCEQPFERFRKRFVRISDRKNVKAQ